MTTNLILATALAYALLGALIMLWSHCTIYTTASRIVAGYPRVLAALRAKRHDGRFGFGVLASGILLQIVAAFGYSAPLSEWRYPVLAVLAALITYCVSRLCVMERAARARTAGQGPRTVGRGLYETRRSVRLREAARLEAPALHARESARTPRQSHVVCIGQEWERRWWSDRLGVSAEALRAAVRHVGPMVNDIERYLANRSRAAA